MKAATRWGIIGPGRIARRFAESMAFATGGVLYGVASRDKQRASDFAEKYEIANVYDSYERLVADPAIDAIYISTPHAYHDDPAVLALKNRKAVLCEKPLSISYDRTRRIVQVARENNVFLMEAMWTRFLPSTLKVLELIDNGSIGDVKYVRADFGVNFPFDATSRIYDLNLGGGSILDIGVYPLFLVLQLFGEPESIVSTGHLSPTGSDELANAMLHYRDGKIGNILSATNVDTPLTAEILGTKGSIVMEAPWYKTMSIRIKRKEQPDEVISVPYAGPGFEFEIQEVIDCLEQGKTESERLPLDFTLQLSSAMDTICKQLGVVYPKKINS